MTDSANLGDTKECPFCAETVKAQANYCKHCKTDLDIQAERDERFITANKPAVPFERAHTINKQIKKHNDDTNALPIIVTACALLIALGGGMYVLTQKKDLQQTNQTNQLTEGGAANTTTESEATIDSDNAKSTAIANESGQAIHTTITEIRTRLEGDTDGSRGDSVRFANGGYTYAYSKFVRLCGVQVGDPVEVILVKLPEPEARPEAIYRVTDLRTHKTWHGAGPLPSQGAPAAATATDAGSFPSTENASSALPKAGLKPSPDEDAQTGSSNSNSSISGGPVPVLLDGASTNSK